LSHGVSIRAPLGLSYSRHHRDKLCGPNPPRNSFTRGGDNE